MNRNTTTDARPLRFLIVDDHPQFRRVVRKFLPGNDSVGIECTNGAEAVARYAHERPDCVLMDLEMAPMDGLAATRAIRRSFSSARIVIVTQHDDAETRAAALAAGAAAFVPKDRLSELRNCLSALVKTLPDPSQVGSAEAKRVSP